MTHDVTPQSNKARLDLVNKTTEGHRAYGLYCTLKGPIRSMSLRRVIDALQKLADVQGKEMPFTYDDVEVLNDAQHKIRTEFKTYKPVEDILEELCQRNPLDENGAETRRTRELRPAMMTMLAVIETYDRVGNVAETVNDWPALDSRLWRMPITDPTNGINQFHGWNRHGNTLSRLGLSTIADLYSMNRAMFLKQNGVGQHTEVAVKEYLQYLEAVKVRQ